MTEMETIQVGKRRIGKGQPCYVIAEAGSNHGNNYARAVELIDIAAEAGADAVKFQVFRADGIAARYVDKTTAITDKQFSRFGKTVHDLFRANELPYGWLPKLARHARTKGVDFLATPFDELSADAIDSIPVVAHKIASFEIIHIPLIRHLATKKRPVILSTGMASISDIEIAVDALTCHGCKAYALLHCSIGYPPAKNEINLKAIDTLKAAFACPVGYSDHTLGLAVPLAAVARGASIIEKHFTYSKRANGPDHAFALEPAELRDLVSGIREVEAAIGDGTKHRFPGEEIHYRRGRRSMFYARDVKAGERITVSDLKVVRPGIGLSPHFYDIILGRKVGCDVKSDQPVSWQHFCGE
jgi:sialic acid synthase SpsE